MDNFNLLAFYILFKLNQLNLDHTIDDLTITNVTVHPNTSHENFKIVQTFQILSNFFISIKKKNNHYVKSAQMSTRAQNFRMIFDQSFEN